MRSVFFVLALVVLSVLAFSSPVQSTTVPYTLCSSTAKYHIKITSLSSDVWPPKKGGHVNVTVNGTTDEAVSSGSYTAKVSYLGLPISTQNGNLSDFKPLPWPAGELDFSYVEAIPDSAPNGKYSAQLSGVDQSKGALFCIDLAFTISSASSEPLTQLKGTMLASPALKRLRQKLGQ